jgi:hypothetical protein
MECSPSKGENASARGAPVDDPGAPVCMEGIALAKGGDLGGVGSAAGRKLGDEKSSSMSHRSRVI